MTAIDEAIEDLGDLCRKNFFHCASVEGTLPTWVHHLAEGAIGEDDAAVGVEGGNAVGDGFKHGFELAATSFEGSVGCAQLNSRVLDGATAVFQVGSHVIEAADDSAQLFGRTLLNAVGVIS